MHTKTLRRRAPRSSRTLSIDEALIVLFIGAMNANHHVAPQEGARAHHLIWSTRRFRRKSGDTVGKLIEELRALLEDGDAATLFAAAARAIPKKLRPPAFAVAADLVLADGAMDRTERKFLQNLGVEAGLDSTCIDRIIDVILIKNAL